MSLFELFSQSYGRLYTLLVAARVVFAFVGTGYIHPDEYFQNGEVTAGHFICCVSKTSRLYENI
ncbi:uncharacterized protein PHACADRAFT_255017 [Phanerochaete carnosa HHB-10118-sp]|uniref:Uncharacterized protein n=1 Tax=Phanerochaete carnosa (strain HHB-10118-sp) TaxID=650164 RepID=K5WE64_PHACS|nr:uncharacterized protein PHACADRAFT_255017 [Phanerochaete carnosa HHB-10118-sp]EKM57319.1 hypothetical protein PHACADRAFT_255017 [Phanerochaete carnosa HHB-10118-sp]